MDKFNQTASEILEEGILQRAKQRIKNMGRSVKHPFSRAFGNSEDHAQAAVTTQKGYKKQKMFTDIIKNSVIDLQKLNVLDPNEDPTDIVEFILTKIASESPYYTFNDKTDLSELGRQIKNI